MSALTAQPLVEDAGSDLASFAGAGAVTKEEAHPVEAAFVVQDQGHAFFRGTAFAGEEVFPGMPCIDDGLELGRRQSTFGDDALRQLRDMVRHRHGDRGHGDGFDQCRRVFAGSVEDNAARTIRQVDADLLAERRRLLQLRIGDRQNGMRFRRFNPALRRRPRAPARPK